MKMSRDRITTDPKFFGGQPYIRGTRILVARILQLLAKGKSFDDIIEENSHLITVEDIEACLNVAISSLSKFSEFENAYTRTMEQRIRELETERQLHEVQRNKLQKERDHLKLQLQECSSLAIRISKEFSYNDFADSYTRTMERRIRALETERQLLEVQRNKLEKERDKINLSLAMSQLNLAKVLLNNTTPQGSNLVQASFYLEEAHQRFHSLQDNAGLELVKELQADLEVQQKKTELNDILSTLPINLTPNILLRSGSDLRSVFLETVRGEYQLDVPQLNTIINLLQLIRDKITLEDSPQN